jgi:VWFA-related protein
MNPPGRRTAGQWLRGCGALIVCVALFLFAKQVRAFQEPGAGTFATPPAQSPQLIPRTHAEREQRFLNQHRIILNVQVNDPSGKPSSNLTQADFTLFDNDQPRKLVAFSPMKGDSAPAPPHVIVVLDTVNNFSRSVRSDEKELEKFLKEGEGPLAYPVSIGVLSGARIDMGEASRDRDVLLADLKLRAGDLHSTGCLTAHDESEGALAKTFGGMAGGGFRGESAQMLTCLNSRFIYSLMALRDLAEAQVDVPGRVILIWIGPGWPQLTNRSFTPDPPEVKQSFFAQLVTLSTVLREAQVTVNAVASPQDLPFPQAPMDDSFFGGIVHEDQMRAGNLGLHALAHQTGGRIVTYVSGMATQIRDCISEAASYYVLTFDAPPAAGFGEYHSLAVKVDKPGLEVRSNTLYYAEQ